MFLRVVSFLLAALAAASAPASAGEPYAPLAVFAPLDGKAFRAEWSDKPGETTIDTVVYEMILGGRALQSTHRIKDSTYGGRSIFFYDEGAKEYVFHYFTTGGFHTSGGATIEGAVMTSEEAVNGHETIGSVRSRATFAPDEIRVEVLYVGKDGTQTPAPVRVYRPVADPGPLFDQ
jgi:hypothetical protein